MDHQNADLQNGVLPSLVEERPQIGITLTVDPRKVLEAYEAPYGLLDPMQQRRVCKEILTMVRSQCEERGIVWERNIMNFECHNNGNVHVHGTIEVHPKYYPYETILKTIGKLAHKYAGRTGKRYTIACTTKWVKEKDEWEKYITKSRGDPLLGPTSIKNIKQKTILDWLNG